MNDDKKNSNVYLKLLDKISKQQEKTQECVNNLDKRVDLHIQKTEYELKDISSTNERQNDMLEDHMRRTELAEIRLTSLEEPSKLVKLLMKIILGLSSLAGTAYIISKIL